MRQSTQAFAAVLLAVLLMYPISQLHLSNFKRGVMIVCLTGFPLFLSNCTKPTPVIYYLYTAFVSFRHL